MFVERLLSEGVRRYSFFVEDPLAREFPEEPPTAAAAIVAKSLLNVGACPTRFDWLMAVEFDNGVLSYIR